MKHRILNYLKYASSLILALPLFLSIILIYNANTNQAKYEEDYFYNLNIAEKLNFSKSETTTQNTIFTKNANFYKHEQLILDYIYQDFVNNRQALVAKEKEAMLQERIQKVEAFFAEYGAAIQGYADIIVRKADECGGDYRLLVGIAGKESGLGRIPYKLYNPYGYLNGVEYSSWEESLSILTCEISRKHLVPCNNDVYCVIKRYGGPDTNVENWIQSVQWFMNQV